MELVIGTGLKAVTIKDEFGEVRGVFKFAPNDTNVYAKFVQLQKDIEIKEKEFKEFEKTGATDEEKVLKMNDFINYLIEKIDKIYGEDTSKILFGHTHDSLIMFKDFFDGIKPIYEEARNKRMDKYKANIERLKQKGVA